MELYHVRLSVSGSRHGEVKIDMSLDQLQEQFLEPYRLGRPIIVNGRTIKLAKLGRIEVSTSDRSARDYIPGLKAKDRSSGVLSLGGPTYLWRAVGQATDVTDRYIKGPPGWDSDTRSSTKGVGVARVSVPTGPGDGRSVFLVHGRNRTITDAMKSFLRSLDLRVIEWEQAVRLTGEPNPYIGDVLLAGLEEAHGIVVLATPDDFVRLDPALAEDAEDPELVEAGQPRQNVIYEAGMAMALAPSRTLIVATPGTKILSDIAGRHLVYLNDSPQARKRIVGRLQTVGLSVDDSGDEWLTVGTFDV